MDILLLLLLSSPVFSFELASNPCNDVFNTAVPHEDPLKYYYCEDGVATERKCPLGTHFDFSVKVLRPPETCGLLYCGLEDHWRDTNPRDCGSYYLCNYGTVTLGNCTEGEHFNKIVGHCLPASDTDCNAQPAYHISCHSEARWRGADLVDCTKYFLCEHGALYHVSCGAGMYYSNDNQMCTTSIVAGCSNIIPTPPSFTTPSFTTSTLKLLPICGPTEIWKEADVLSCKNYYQCKNGGYSYESCQDGFEFNSVFKECQPAEITGCSVETITLDNENITFTVEPPNSSSLITCMEYEQTPDPEDCSAYYKCVDGRIVHLYCPWGYQFSVTENDCLPAEEANCNPQPTLVPKTTTDVTTPEPMTLEPPPCGSFQEWLFPDYFDCSYHYLCSGGDVYHLQCVPSYQFSSTEMKCVPQKEANCSPQPTLVPKTTTDVTTPEPMTLEPPPCGSLQEWLFPDYFDCSYYYLCFGGDVYQLQCVPPYQFSSTEMKCVPQKEANCSPQPTLVPMTTTDDTTPAPMSAIFDYTEITFTDEPPNRPSLKTCVEYEQGPDLEDCSAYYKCVDEEIVHLYCPWGFGYSITENDCLPAEESNCSPRSTILPEITTDNTTAAPMSAIFDFEELTFTEEPLNPSSLRTCMEYEQGPDLEDCSAYYKCVDGEIVHLHCLWGFEFSIVENECLPKEIAGCSILLSPATTTSIPRTIDIVLPITTPSIPRTIDIITSKYIPETKHSRNCEPCLKCTVNDVFIAPDPDSCDYYYLCIKGELTHTKCPHNFDYSLEKKECLPKSMVNCIKPDSTALTPTIQSTTIDLYIPIKCVNSTAKPLYFVVDDNDCRHYYMCALGTATRETCPEGYEFSPKYLVCLPSDEAQCGTICSSDDVQFVPDPHDVTRYYICFEGKPLPQKCPAKFHFDPHIKMCKEVCDFCEN